MNTRKSRQNILTTSIAALVSLALTNASSAANLYWDGLTPAGGPTGGNGNWNTSLTNWDTSLAGGDVAWNNANLDTAVFGSTVGTVALTEPMTVGGLTFYTTGYVITATSPNTLTFGAGDNTVKLNSTGATAATITGTVAGGATANVILTGANSATGGTLTLNGTSTGGWGGTTTIGNNKTLALSGLNQGLNSTTGITLNSGNITLTNTAATAVENNRISNAAITTNGGNITLANTAGPNVYAETIGSVALTRGQMNFVFSNTQSASAGSQTLTLSGLTRTGATNTSSVFFGSNSGLSATKNIMQVTGATATTAGRIIAPWAYAGNTAGAFDYAIYDASGNVLPANATLVAGGEAGWTVATDAYNNNVVTQTLAGTRTITALRNSATTATLTVATGANLETKGLLNGAATLLTVAATGTGALTTPTGGGNLHINAGNATSGGAVTISAPINNNGGNVTVVKDGLGTLTLSSITSNYSGGTVVNAGTLTWTANTNLGLAGSRNITVNGTGTLSGFSGTSLDSLTVGEGAVATLLSQGYNFTTTSGSGTLLYAASATNSATTNLGNASGFTGNVVAQMGGGTNIRPIIQFSSIGDAVGSALQFGGNSTDSGQDTTMKFNGSAPLVFNNRRIETLPATGGNNTAANTNLFNDSALAANTWIINTAYSFLSNQGRSLVLRGSNTGANAFNGVISNGDNGGTVTVVKNDAGTWILGGNNTHSGGTTLTAGTLNIGHAGALGTGTFTIGAGTFNTSGGVGITNANNNAIAWNGDATFTGSNSLNLGTGAVTMGGNRSIVVSASSLFFGGVISDGVSDFNITLGGNGRLVLTNENNSYSGKTVVGNDVGSSLTIQVSKLADLSQNSSLGAPTTAPLGLIQLGSVSRPSTLDYIGTSASSTDRQIQIGSAANGSGGSIINNNSVSSSHTLTFSNAAFNVASAASTSRGVTLGGSNTGDNTITGAIINNTGTVAVTKSGVGTWVLNGTSSYTGAVNVTNGTLKVNSIKDSGTNSAVGAGTLIALGSGSTTGTLVYTGSGDDATRSIRVGSGTVGDTGGGVLNNDGAGALNFTAATFNTAVAGVTAARNLTLGGAYSGAVNEIVGDIVNNDTGTGGTVSITKAGAATWELSGTNAYTGATTVNGGTLLVSGSLSGSSAVAVNNGGTLGGTGTVGGATTVANGGKLSPGASPGTLFFSSSLDISAVNTASSLVFELGTSSDLVDLTAGTLSIGTGTLGFSEFAFSNSGGLVAGTYTLFETENAITGSLDSGDLTGSFAGGMFLGTLSLANGDTDLVLTVVPEPSSVALLGLGVFGLMRRRRRES